MKNLYLLRHAKSRWDNPGLSDHLRPLNQRGKRNAPAMALRFVERGETLDLIITSPAERARTTAGAFASACGLAADQFREVSSLYFQGLSAFESSIRDCGEAADSLMLVSHNPDLTSFANRLDQRLSIDNVPTCGLLLFECDIEQWRNWSADKCRFVYYDYPKNPVTTPVTDCDISQ